MPQGSEVGGQVAVDDEYVGAVPAPKTPLRPAEPDRRSCAAGGSDQRRHGAGYLAKLDHRIGVVAVSLDAGDTGVGTGDQSDAEGRHPPQNRHPHLNEDLGRDASAQRPLNALRRWRQRFDRVATEGRTHRNTAGSQSSQLLLSCMGLGRPTFGRTDHIRRVFDALHTDCDGLVDRSGRMGVRGHRQTGIVCLLDQQPQLLDRELRGEHVGARGDQAAACHHLDHVNLSLHPLSYGSHDFVCAADLAAEVAAVATRGGDRWTGGKDPGQPIVNVPLRVAPFHHTEVPRSRMVVTPAASWRRSDSLTTPSISSGEYPATRSSAITPLLPTR